eukprot:COSAG05_NODE_1239_length_5425_cov_3.841532_2_plen_613_part_00
METMETKNATGWHHMQQWAQALRRAAEAAEAVVEETEDERRRRRRRRRKQKVWAATVLQGRARGHSLRCELAVTREGATVLQGYVRRLLAARVLKKRLLKQQQRRQRDRSRAAPVSERATQRGGKSSRRGAPSPAPSSRNGSSRASRAPPSPPSPPSSTSSSNRQPPSSKRSSPSHSLDDSIDVGSGLDIRDTDDIDSPPPTMAYRVSASGRRSRSSRSSNGGRRVEDDGDDGSGENDSRHRDNSGDNQEPRTIYEVALSYVFTKPFKQSGHLGFVFEPRPPARWETTARAGNRVVVSKIQANSVASSTPCACIGMRLLRVAHLEPGRAKTGVRGEPVMGMSYQQVMQLLQARPIMMIFEHPWQETSPDRARGGVVEYVNSFTGAKQRHRPAELGPVVEAMERRASLAESAASGGARGQGRGGGRGGSPRGQGGPVPARRGQISIRSVQVEGLPGFSSPSSAADSEAASSPGGSDVTSMGGSPVPAGDVAVDDHYTVAALVAQDLSQEPNILSLIGREVRFLGEDVARGACERSVSRCEWNATRQQNCKRGTVAILDNVMDGGCALVRWKERAGMGTPNARMDEKKLKMPLAALQLMPDPWKAAASGGAAGV